MASATAPPDAGSTACVLDREGLGALVRELRARDRTVIGPAVRDETIALAEVESADELPYGWGVEHEAGYYRIRRRSDTAAFAHSAGPQSRKYFLHPERVRQWSADRDPEGGMTVRAEHSEPPSFAFLGVQPCDLRAIRIQDRVMIGGPHRDDTYGARRSGAFLIVVECAEPGATCFCVSMDTGPAARSGCDPALTEVVDEAGHRFLVRAGTEEGAEVLASLPRRPADDLTRTRAHEGVEAADGRMGRTMPEVDLRALLAGTLEAERWNDVAARCLTCGNCTMACPPCFCTTAEDVADLTGDRAERWRRWESCYDLEFTHLPGGSVRSSGCVGCGRCIVWCPVGIDITEEAHALHREGERQAGGKDEAS
ncbi:4Fe-4S dicluster domain-containing protein [Streptomyces roseoverticillatus]|uniref:4Fe-4S dicluster domain-containing protein n=1 Tax=Streptomyces roseoverticillatus TaxID=66429 RepID=UPI001F1EBA67|nr:4Fe-4S dicluster domain-containing protein [Streptomyces roseoverticillatus]MCF3103176.1 4Fe-4S dicluster domain-containing protein [Streptomyces roseoverticillatus]